MILHDCVCVCTQTHVPALLLRKHGFPHMTDSLVSSCSTVPSHFSLAHFSWFPVLILYAWTTAVFTPPSLVARTGHTLLDLDKPLCHLGVTALLHRLLPALGRDYLVRTLKPHMASVPPAPAQLAASCTGAAARTSLVSRYIFWSSSRQVVPSD